MYVNLCQTFVHVKINVHIWPTHVLYNIACSFVWYNIACSFSDDDDIEEIYDTSCNPTYDIYNTYDEDDIYGCIIDFIKLPLTDTEVWTPMYKCSSLIKSG